MKHGITGIDHPVLAVRNMTAARGRYERLGFVVPPPGRHLEWGTGNWCIMFPRDYLELRGVVDPSRYLHGLDAFLARREGLLGIAFGTDDADASYRQLLASGFHPGTPHTLTRSFELPSGPVQPRFNLCFLDSSEVPGLGLVVLCQHLTPELIRRPEWLLHPNGATCVLGVTCAVRDVEAAREAHLRFAGKDSPVRFVTGEDGPVAVTLGVIDPDLTCFRLQQHHVPFHRDGDAIRVAPEQCCGAELEFRPQPAAPY